MLEPKRDGSWQDSLTILTKSIEGSRLARRRTRIQPSTTPACATFRGGDAPTTPGRGHPEDGQAGSHARQPRENILRGRGTPFAYAALMNEGDLAVPLPPENPTTFELLLTTAHRLGIEVTDELAFEHVSVMGLMVVLLLARAPRSPRAVSAALGCSPASATKLVDRLVRAGFVVRTPDPQDGRAKVLRLTSSGARYGAFAKEALDRCMDSCAQHFSVDERASLHSLLARLERGADWHRVLRYWTSNGPCVRRPPSVHVR